MTSVSVTSSVCVLGWSSSGKTSDITTNDKHICWFRFTCCCYSSIKSSTINISSFDNCAFSDYICLSKFIKSLNNHSGYFPNDRLSWLDRTSQAWAMVTRGTWSRVKVVIFFWFNRSTRFWFWAGFTKDINVDPLQIKSNSDVFGSRIFRIMSLIDWRLSIVRKLWTIRLDLWTIGYGMG